MKNTYQPLFEQLQKLRSGIYEAAMKGIGEVPAIFEHQYEKRLVFDDPLQTDESGDNPILGLFWHTPEGVDDSEIMPYRADGHDYFHNLENLQLLCMLERLEKGQYTIEKENKPQPEQDTTRFHKGSLAVAPTGTHQLAQEGMYLRLWHGFRNSDERNKADDWGADGPIIGPLDYCHTTYASEVKLCFADKATADRFQLQQEDFLYIANDCLIFGDIEYGDWSVFYHKPKTD